MTLLPDWPATPTRPQRRNPWPLMGLWLLTLALLAAVAPGLQNTLGVPWEVLPLIMLAPALSAGVVVLAGRRRLPTPWPAVPTRALVSPVLLAVLFLAVFTTTAAIVVGRVPALPTQVVGVPLAAWLVLQTLGAFGEEIGWRGLMQRLGETVAPPPVVVLVLGTLFGATHLGVWPLGPVFLAWFTASSVLMCLAMLLVWRGDFWQRMIPATLIHAGTNVAVFALGDITAGPPWHLVIPGAAGLSAVLVARVAGRALAGQAR